MTFPYERDVTDGKCRLERTCLYIQDVGKPQTDDPDENGMDFFWALWMFG